MAPNDINPTQTRQVFISSDLNQRIVRVPAHETLGHAADQLVTRPALAYDFQDGFLVIDDERRANDEAYFERWKDKLGLTRDENGVWSEDLAGKWRPNEPAEEWLRSHERFGIPHGFAENEFVQSGSAEPLARVTELLIEENIEGLVELYEQEERGENRRDVLKAAAGALGKLEAQQGAPAG